MIESLQELVAATEALLMLTAPPRHAGACPERHNEDCTSCLCGAANTWHKAKAAARQAQELLDAYTD